MEKIEITKSVVVFRRAKAEDLKEHGRLRLGYCYWIMNPKTKKIENSPYVLSDRTDLNFLKWQLDMELVYVPVHSLDLEKINQN